MPETREEREERLARLNAKLNAKAMLQSQRFILGRYHALGRDPVYAGDMLVSPELADKLAPPRRLDEVAE